jgi:hypothetical protein
LHVAGDFGFLKTENGAMNSNDGILIFVDRGIAKQKKTIEKTFDISLNKGWRLRNKGNSYYIDKKR